MFFTDRKGLDEHVSKFSDDLLGDHGFGPLDGDFAAAIRKKNRHIIVILAKDFTDTDLINHEHFAALAQ